MYHSIHSLVDWSDDTDIVHQLLWLSQPSLLIAIRHDGYGLHQWDVTLEQLQKFFKVVLSCKCSLTRCINEIS